MTRNLVDIWSSMEKKQRLNKKKDNRIYRRLNLGKETGIRLSLVSPENYRELLIQIDSNDDRFEFAIPKWKGMKFEIINLDVPEKNTPHIRLFLEDPQYNDIFIIVCSDIIDSLLKVKEVKNRFEELLICLDRWNRFFQRYGSEGLAPNEQQGLYGELYFLKKILHYKINKLSAVKSWKGPENNIHDFEVNKVAIEVKTTMTKEPRHVEINSEKQLDDRGLKFLFLFILSLKKNGNLGQTLPKLVNEIRNLVSKNNQAFNLFNQYLRESGYLDIHAKEYKTSYIILNKEIFTVNEDFPRIISIPQGLGNLKYSLFIGAISRFEINTDKLLKENIECEK